jgi:DNA polymerase family A
VSADGRIVCSRVVFLDSEFDAKKGRGERPGPPVCFCAIEIDQDGREIEHRLAAPYPARAPWDRGDPYLTVGFALAAEAGSMLHLGWTFPLPAIDLYAEYMTLHNTEMSRGESGKLPGPTMIEACQRYRAIGMDKAHKDEMRALAYTKSDHTPEEIALLQDYCIEDDRMLMRLYAAMLPFIDLLRAPIRGAFMMEIERVRWRGIPIDEDTYRRAEVRAPEVRAKMRAELNRKLGTDIYEDKRMIDALRTLKLEIGADGRNRAWFNPFGTKTGRNNPSTNRSLFGLPHTMRSFMKPPPGKAIAQVDYGSQEIGIAAALSGDPRLLADYLGGDPYRAFAAASLGILNPTEQQRQVYKSIVLGRIYGMGPATLARNAGITKAQAERIFAEMAARYPVLEAWLARVQVKAAHCIPITCALGWSLSAAGRPGEERTFLNFPMQANAAEMMRLVFVRSAHLPVIWCAHDSFLIEDDIDKIERTVVEMQEIMRGVSRDLLGGFELRADCKSEKGDIVRYPDRFVDKREREDEMRHWNRLMALTEEGDDRERIRSANPAGRDDASPHRHQGEVEVEDEIEAKTAANF